MHSDRIPSPLLPPSAAPAVEIVGRLVASGHRALLAGGCVRDLLLGGEPSDFDVATDAPPQRVMQLFRPTRHVGAQFGVVLVRQRDRWVEVATFRTDGDYRDGRRPESVTFSGPAEDARRRDFTVNGMFLDPLSGDVIDYVGGRADLQARTIRAIGDPAARFREDHLRLLRAVRFAARLAFTIEPLTAAAIRAAAPALAGVATERVREELAKMLSAPTRTRAVRLLHQLGLLMHVVRGAGLDDTAIERGLTLLDRLPRDTPFALALAVLLSSRSAVEVDGICRRLTCANDEREAVSWLVANQAALDEPARPSLAELKRLMAHPWFPSLRDLAAARQADLPDADARRRRLHERCTAVAPESIAPPPLVTGDELLARGIAPGPVYSRILSELYTRQLNEELGSREAALRALDALLASDNRDC